MFKKATPVEEIVSSQPLLSNDQIFDQFMEKVNKEDIDESQNGIVTYWSCDTDFTSPLESTFKYFFEVAIHLIIKAMIFPQKGTPYFWINETIKIWHS